MIVWWKVFLFLICMLSATSIGALIEKVVPERWDSIVAGGAGFLFLVLHLTIANNLERLK